MILLIKAKVYIVSNSIYIMDKIIMKVRKNKTTNQKMITIPKDCDVEEGDYVEIIKL